jgi:predicted aldo/keto reductase-like oxidoreductase
MKTHSTRRDFLSAGVALPAVGFLGMRDNRQKAVQVSSGGPSVKLQYRTLGRTGLKVTTVGFGCMITSDPSVIERAADIGINYFDTARVYQGGNNERMVGAALKRKRKEIILSTKVPSDTKDQALKDLETSLRELATDYVDIWYLHGKSGPSDITDDLLEAQRIAKQQGKVRFSGVSTHSGQKELLPWLAKTGAVDVVLVAYNFTMDQAMSAAVEAAGKAGLGVVGMKVMAGGFRRAKPGDPLYEKLKTEGTMLAALKWVIKNSHVHTTIPSMTDMDQLDENLRAMQDPFAAADEKLLARQLDFITPLYCRMCGKCHGTCARGLPVEDILRHLTYADGYGQFALGREEFLKLGSDTIASRCGDCQSCTVRCPYGVHVSARVSRAQELFA